MPSEFNPAVPPPTLFKNPPKTHHADLDPAHHRHSFPPGRPGLTDKEVEETAGKRKLSMEDDKTEEMIKEKPLIKKIKTEIKRESSSDEYEETKTIRILR